MTENRSQVNVNDSYAEKYGFHEAENYTFKSRKGLDDTSHGIVDHRAASATSAASGVPASIDSG